MDVEIKEESEINLKPSTSGEVHFPHENKYSHIKNKLVRNQQFQKSKREQKKVVKLRLYLHKNHFLKLIHVTN